MAGIIIVCMLAMSSKSTQYAVSVSEVTSLNDGFYRLEGFISSTAPETHKASLCDKNICIDVIVPDEYLIQTNKRIIAEGHIQDGKYHITKILTRCDHGQP